MLQLACVVLLPVVIGMAWRHRFPVSCGRWQPLLHRFSVALFGLVIIAIIIDRGTEVAGHLADAGAVCMSLILLAMLAGFLLARAAGLGERQVKTISIEVGMQHGGMALVVTQGILMNPAMSIVPLTYGLLMLIPVAVMALTARAGAQRESIV